MATSSPPNSGELFCGSIDPISGPMNVRYALVWSGCETEDLVHEGALSGDVVSRHRGHLSLGQHGLKPSMGRVRRLISRLSLHEVAALAAPEPNYATFTISVVRLTAGRPQERMMKMMMMMMMMM